MVINSINDHFLLLTILIVLITILIMINVTLHLLVLLNIFNPLLNHFKCFVTSLQLLLFLLLLKKLVLVSLNTFYLRGDLLIAALPFVPALRS